MPEIIGEPNAHREIAVCRNCDTKISYKLSEVSVGWIGEPLTGVLEHCVLEHTVQCPQCDRAVLVPATPNLKNLSDA